MATEGDAYGTSLNGTRSAYARSPVFERALGGHWAQGKTQGSGVFAKFLHSSHRPFQASSLILFPKSAKRLFEGGA